MFRVTAEFQDVPLRQTHVFQQLPGSVRSAGRFYSTQPGRDVGHYGVEAGMCVASSQKIQKMLPQRVGFSHDLEKHKPR